MFPLIVSSRITKFLVAYVGASAGALQFLDWIATRYLLSKSLVDLMLWLLLLMLPTVFLIAWHAEPARPSAHKRVVSIGVPLNLLLAALVLFIIFHGKRLGATTDVVEVRDDNGTWVNRRVPKLEFREKVALFTFELEPGSDGDSWLRQAAPWLLGTDLDQDPFVEVWSNYGLRTPFHRAHLTIDSTVPLAFAREATQSHYVDYFVFGTVKKQGDQYRVRVTLNSSQRGHAVSEHEASGPDLFALIDELSPQLRRDLGVPAPHLESAPDLPIAEITTRSLPALAEWTLSNNRDFEDDRAGSMTHLEKAVAIDPTFAVAHAQLFFAYYQAHRSENLQREMDATLANLYKLPEPTRFYFNEIRYLLQGNADKQLAVLNNWVTLHPKDAQARYQLGQYYYQRDDNDKALASFEEGLAINLSDTETLQRVAEMHMLRGEPDQAFAIYRRYLDQYPNDTEMHVDLGDRYRQAARLADARASYQRALAIDAENVSAAVGIAELDFTAGDYDGATARLEKLLGETRLGPDRMSIYGALLEDYQLRGQMKRALEIFTAKQSEYARIAQGMDLIRAQLNHCRLYVLNGRTDEARRALVQAAADTVAMKQIVNLQIAVEIGRLELDSELDDGAALRAHLPDLEKTVREFGLEVLRPVALPYLARLAELEHDYAGALVSWQKMEKREQWLARPALAIARCQRQLGNLDAARAQAERTVARFPGDPEAHYELALSARQSNPTVAHAELDKALAIWAPADPEYQPAKAARALAVSFPK